MSITTFYQYELEVRYNDKIVLLFTCCQMFLIENRHVHSFFILFKEEVLKVYGWVKNWFI